MFFSSLGGLKMSGDLNSFLQKKDSILVTTVCLRNNLEYLEEPPPPFFDINGSMENIGVVDWESDICKHEAFRRHLLLKELCRNMVRALVFDHMWNT
jgi:hypothetical protein